MRKYLPGECVIYLDADILVRKDLRDLWNLEGHAIAAPLTYYSRWVVLVYPGGEYFKPAVSLIDLVKVPTAFPEFETFCFEMKDAPYCDQDPLNVHFRGNQLWLNLTWNTQRLGTAAEWYDADREKLPLEQLKDPAIVHFI